MSNIRTYADLQQEKSRLEASLVIQKGVIREDIKELREEFRPALDLLSFVGKISKRTSNNPLIGMGISLVGATVLKKMALAGSGKIAGLVVPFLAEKISSHFTKKSNEGFLHKISGLWNKLKSNGNHKV